MVTTENLIQKMREAGVPEALIPKLLPRLKAKLDVKNWLKMQEELADEAAEREEDYIDKQKREAFSLWLIFLLLILIEDQPNPTTFFHESYRKMHDRHARPNPIIGEDAFIERSLTAIAMLKYPRADVEEALQIGQPSFEDTTNFKRGKVTKVFPMHYAIRSIEQSQQTAAAVPILEPLEPAPTDTDKDTDNKEEVTLKTKDSKDSVAYPNF